MNQGIKIDILKVLLTLYMIAAITCFISVFLPYVSVINANFSLKDAFANEDEPQYGYLILLLGASGLAFFFSLYKKTEWGIFGAVVLITERYSTREVWEGKSGSDMSAFEKVIYNALIGKEIGYYGIIIGSVVLILTGVVYSYLSGKSGRANITD